MNLLLAAKEGQLDDFQFLSFELRIFKRNFNIILLMWGFDVSMIQNPMIITMIL